MSEIRILIADQHAMVRQGIRALLETESKSKSKSDPALTVVGETASGLTALELLAQLRPDVLLLDLVLPGLDGLEVARQCHRRWPETKVVVLSMHSNEGYVFKALQVGVNGYVLKSCESPLLIQAIQSVLKGDVYLSPPLSMEKVRAFSSQTKSGQVDLYDTLTKREKEVLQLTTEGLTNVLMAEKLKISPRTVEVHRANLMKKLRVENQSQLVRFSLSRGLFRWDDLPPPASTHPLLHSDSSPRPYA